jgi:ADP-ribose pyrophosphatase YjhB (NUDIX family)
MEIPTTQQAQALETAEQPNRVATIIPYITTRVLIEYDNQYLYLLQTEERGGKLSLPGGKVKHKEFAREGLIREILEETNLTVIKKDLKHVHTTHRKKIGEFEVIFFFKVLIDNADDLALNEPHKFQGFVWLPKDEIPDNSIKEVRFALRKLKKDKIFSEYPKKNKDLLEVEQETALSVLV